MENILCPVDFSDTSLKALEAAAQIGAKHRSRILLINVFNLDESKLKFSQEAENKDTLITVARRKLKALAEEVENEYCPKGLLRCDFKLVEGSTVSQIVETSLEREKQLIVLGTTGISGSKKSFVGGTTAEIIGKSQIPVLCIPESFTDINLQHIVYASELVEEDKVALARLAAFCHPFGSTIKVVHLSKSKSDKTKTEFLAFQDEMKSYITTTRLYFDLVGMEQDLTHQLDQYMKNDPANFLVLLSYQRNFFEKIFSKSLSKSMSYLVDYPLMIFKV
ncbi:MAG: universal stress protein [Cyclobacteriaceae bacterium]|nr:universal stress protein [Cyclobacteriaceae bacterium]MCH8515908.1 universal stress protein [Cyclobacteriaceae bacterium]